MIDKKTYAFLKHLYKVDYVSREEADAFFEAPKIGNYNSHTGVLQRCGLIALVSTSDEPDKDGKWKPGPEFFRITVEGRAYVEQQRRNLWNFWLPYSITTVLATASLIVAICGLLL